MRTRERTRPRQLRRRDAVGDRGQITLFVVILSAGALMVISLVYFQGLKLRAGRDAGNIAEEAARAGAGQLDRDRAYRDSAKVVDPAAAARQAQAYLAAAGQTGTVTVTILGARKIQVTVTIVEPTPMLSIIGVGSISVTRTATADLVTGVEGPDQ